MAAADPAAAPAVSRQRWDRLRCFWTSLRVDDTAADQLCGSSDRLWRDFGEASYSSRDVAKSCGEAIAWKSLAGIGSAAVGGSGALGNCRAHAINLACDLGYVLDDAGSTGVAKDFVKCACALEAECNGAAGGDSRRHFAGLADQAALNRDAEAAAAP